MTARFIGLTGREPLHMGLVAHRLLELVTDKQLQIPILIGVTSLEEAAQMTSDDGELWRVGFDLTRPELDSLIDRQIDTAADHATMLQQVDYCLGQFLAKTQQVAT